MKTREPKDLFVASQDDIARSEREFRSAWDGLAALLGLVAVGVALSNGQPLFRALLPGVTAFGVLVGGFRIAGAVFSLLLPIYEEIVERILLLRAEWSIRRAQGHPVLSHRADRMGHHVLQWRDWRDRRMMRRRLRLVTTRAPAKVQRGAEEATSVTKGQDHSLNVTSVDADRWADPDAQRWGDIASFKLFNKPIDAIIDDFEGTMGRIPADMLEALIELGKEIEAAEASRARPATADPHSNLRASGADRLENENPQREGVHAHPTPHGDRAGSAEAENERQATAGRPPLPGSSRFAVTRFRVLVLAMLSMAVAGVFWTTRWQYLESRGPRGTVTTMRVNRWTGAAQVFGCGLTQEGSQQVRALQTELANVTLESQRGLEALLISTEILPCSTCPVDGERAEAIAKRFRSERKPPWGTDPRILSLLERLEAVRAAHWQCAYR